MSLIVFHPQAVAFVGRLDVVDLHRHAAPAIVVGLSRPIRFFARGQAVVEARGAIIAPGVQHELHVAEQQALTLYMEPGSGWARAVMRACGQSAFLPLADHQPWCQLAQALTSGSPDAGVCNTTLTLALDSLLTMPLAGRIDARIEHALARCRWEGEEDAALLARRVCLSGSRLRHLFVEDTGTTLSRYRLWCRIRRAVISALAGQSLTAAAVEAGFFDSAHFSRSFREMFGVSPSAILAREDLIVVASNDPPVPLLPEPCHARPASGVPAFTAP